MFSMRYSPRLRPPLWNWLFVPAGLVVLFWDWVWWVGVIALVCVCCGPPHAVAGPVTFDVVIPLT